MRRPPKTNQELIKENASLKRRIKKLEKSEAEYRRAEEHTAESEREKAVILDTMSEIVVYIDRDMKVIWANRAMYDAFNLKPETFVGKQCYRYHKRKDPCSFCPALKAMETGQPQVYSNLKSYDKNWVLRGYPVRDKNHNIIGAVEIVTDVTDFRNAVDALSESRQQLANIIEFLPDATFVIDNQGRVIAWNRAMEDLTGVDAADMLGKGDYEYALPFYGERRPILIDLVLKPHDQIEEKYASIEKRDFVLMGEAYMPALKTGGCYIFITASALRDSRGEIAGAIESIRDITDRKQVEKKYQDIFENAIMGIFQTTPKGRIISANPAFARIVGYSSPEELIASSGYLLRHLYVNKERLAELSSNIEKQGNIKEFEIEVFKKDGGTIWITINASAIRNSRDETLYYEGTIQDITARKTLESQLRQSQKMEAIGTLASGIAHDFNNILSVIMGYTDMTIGKLEKSSPLHRYLDHVFKAGERARDLVKQILAFSRQSEETLHPLKISPIIKESMKLLRSSLPATINISQEIQADPDTVLAAPTHIHQIIMNLCSNSAHAMKEKKGTLTVRLAPEEIAPGDSSAPSGLAPGMYLKLSVSDTGTGIDPIHISRIFDPFFTTKKHGEGTGLGLSIVYGIVKSYGGEIIVQSDPGRGTDVNVYLPLLTDVNGGTEQHVRETTPVGRECILLVDDEKTLVDIGKTMLTELGYDVITKTGSVEALELFKTSPERFDLIITDMTMPYMTGIELSQEIMKIRPGLPIILCTGFSESVTPEKVKDMGLKALVMKPVIRHQLAVTIRKVLDQTE